MSWLDALVLCVRLNRSCVVVMISELAGSAPRPVGTRMVVTADDFSDTLGGGALEMEAISHARALLESGMAGPLVSSRTVLLGNELNQCCGGRVTLQFDIHPANDFTIHVFGAGHVAQEVARLAHRLPVSATFHDSREDWLLQLMNCLHGYSQSSARKHDMTDRTDLSIRTSDRVQSFLPDRLDNVDFNAMLNNGSNDGSNEVLIGVLKECVEQGTEEAANGRANSGSKAGSKAGSKVRSLAVANASASKDATTGMYKGIGAGSAAVLNEGDYRATLPGNMAGATIHLRQMPDNVHAVVESCEPGAYYLVMTHSHELDLDVVEAILTRGDARYCGLIASNSKAAKFRSRLHRKGFTDAELAGLTAPVGGDRKTGNTPMEVAVAAMSDILHLRQLQLERRNLNPESTPCT